MFTRIRWRLVAWTMAVLTLILLTLITFANTLPGKFIYDDQRVVLRNPLLGHWDLGPLKAIFTHDDFVKF